MGLDSVEVVMAWERAFCLVVSNAEARRLSTVGDVVDFVVERLLRKGLIEALPSPTDRRRVEISLTAAGRAFLDRARPVAARISDRTARKLSARELDRLLALLDKL